MWTLHATNRPKCIVTWAYRTIFVHFRCVESQTPQGFTLSGHRSGTSAQLKSAEEFTLWAKYRSTADAPPPQCRCPMGFFFLFLFLYLFVQKPRRQGFSEFPHTFSVQQNAYTRPGHNVFSSQPTETLRRDPQK